MIDEDDKTYFINLSNDDGKTIASWHKEITDGGFSYWISDETGKRENERDMETALRLAKKIDNSYELMEYDKKYNDILRAHRVQKPRHRRSSCIRLNVRKMF